MAKLNQTEITAIAEQIKSDILNKNREYNNKLKEVEYKKWFKNFSQTNNTKKLKHYCENTEILNELTKDLNYDVKISKRDFEDVVKAIF